MTQCARRIGSAVFVFLAVSSAGFADELPESVSLSVDRGLQFLERTQHADGHWVANDGQSYPTAMTAMAGMTMLMEGSTLRDGRFSTNIRRAADWLMERAQPNGLIGNPRHPTEANSYMFGHGFGMLFLSCLLGEEEDAPRRVRLEKILTRAVQFCGKAQTPLGGWGYLTAADGGNFDEGSVTITQLQGLRAARNAGIVVPKSIIDRAVEYLRQCTTDLGGVIYSLKLTPTPIIGRESAALTAAAVACSFSAGEYDSGLAKKWLLFCRDRIAFDNRRHPHHEYMHYYLAQAIYILGNDRWEKAFPNENDSSLHLTWSRYKKQMFQQFITSQAPDGSWRDGHIGATYTSSIYLTILQLEKGSLPIYAR